MKNNLIELPIWCTTLDCDWLPETKYGEHLLEIGNAESSYTRDQKEQLSLRGDFELSIEKEATKFWGEYGMNPEYKPVITQAWSNRHGKGGWTDWHSHAQCDLAAVWYPKFKEGNGNLVFRNPLDIYQSSETRYDDPLIEVFIQEKDLIIFPAFLLHKTQINTIDDARIVVSLNFKGELI